MDLLFLGLFTIVSFVVGIRLFSRGWATGARVELILGAHTLLINTGNMIVQAAATDGWNLTFFGQLTVRTAGVMIDAGYTAFALFCVEVYRPEVPRLRKIAVALLIAIIAAQPLGVMYMHRLDVSFLMECALRMSSYAWGSFEAFRFYGIMRRRAHYGMGDPMVENRFLLWGIATTLALFILIALSIAYKLPPTDANRAPFMSFSAALAVPASALVWITFFPPNWYRERIERKSDAEGAAT